MAFVACVQVQGQRGYVLIFGGLSVNSNSQDQILKTKTTGSQQRHFADLTFKGAVPRKLQIQKENTY